MIRSNEVAKTLNAITTIMNYFQDKPEEIAKGSNSLVYFHDARYYSNSFDSTLEAVAFGTYWNVKVFVKDNGKFQEI